MSMNIDDLKRALVEVRELCGNTRCITCALHKTQEETGIPYCPLFGNEDDGVANFPTDWDIDDWGDTK